MPDADIAHPEVKAALLKRLSVNVAALRESGNWSTRALAEHTRLGRRTIQRLEQMEFESLSLDKLDVLARGLGVRTASLLGERPVPRQDEEPLTRTTLAANLVRARKQRDWSQEVLSAHSGVSRAIIAHIEREARNPDLMTLIRLAAALEATVEQLIMRDEL